MNIFDMIIRDHDEAKELMEVIAKERDTEEACTAFEELKAALLAHAKAEQEVLYHALRERRETHALILEADEEHRLAEQMLDELERGDASDDEWHAKFVVLKHSVEHHMREEENALLPKAKHVLSRDEVAELTDDFVDAKAKYEGVLVGA
ncbi:hemerythrin domain-containing protein [Candidatus Uhrbacteria bacterium]|nr:hemerythrin domain-containing protein [Candidatus Uhrbacteria bacterium]